MHGGRIIIIIGTIFIIASSSIIIFIIISIIIIISSSSIFIIISIRMKTSVCPVKPDLMPQSWPLWPEFRFPISSDPRCFCSFPKRLLPEIETYPIVTEEPVRCCRCHVWDTVSFHCYSSITPIAEYELVDIHQVFPRTSLQTESDPESPDPALGSG